MNDSNMETINSNHNLDNLPDLIYYHLFKYLDLDEVFGLRLINKKFYSIIKSYDIIELSIVKLDDQFGRGRLKTNWFSSSKSNKRRNNIKSLHSPLSCPSSNLLGLKYLKIFLDRLSFRLEDLNKFNKLEFLEPEINHFIDISSSPILQLQNLKSFSFECKFKGPNDLMIIDTPNLCSLSILNRDNFRQVDFVHPLSVKYLRICLFSGKEQLFSDLECLELFKIFKDFDVKDVLGLKKLRILRVVDYIEDLAKLAEIFRSRKDLEMILDGIRIKELNQFGAYFTKDQLKIQLENYELLENNLSFVKEIRYDYLLDLLPNQPVDFLKKFNNIQLISIESKIKDENRLINFIKECPNLNDLFIDGTPLSQQFYDRLPTISLLNRLCIFKNDEITHNFEFIMKISYLNCFKSDQDVLNNGQLNLNNLEYLQQFMFRVNGHLFNLYKKGKDCYSIDNWYDLKTPERLCRNLKFDEIVKWSNYIRERNEPLWYDLLAYK